MEILIYCVLAYLALGVLSVVFFFQMPWQLSVVDLLWLLILYPVAWYEFFAEHWK